MKRIIYTLNMTLVIIMFGTLPVACQPNVDEMPDILLTPRSVATVSSIRAVTPTPTLASEPSTTATMESTETASSTPVAFTPTRISTSTQTPSPWLLDSVDEFILFEARDGLRFFTNGATSQYIQGGTILSGQPWSPDKSRFLFRIGRSDTVQVILVDFTTGEKKRLDLLFKGTIPYWSPDGRFILYQAPNTISPPYNSQLVLYDVETEENIVIVDIARAHRNQTVLVGGWSPDGQKIAYVAEVEGQYDVFTIDMTSFTVQQLTNTPEAETQIHWSPTENILAVGETTRHNPFSVWPFSAERLFLIDEMGINLGELGNYSSLSSFSWSSGGIQIAYSDDGNLCILNVEDASATCPIEVTYPPEAFAMAFRHPATWFMNDESLIFSLVNRNEVTCPKMYRYDFLTEMIEELDEACTSGLFYVNK